METTIRSDAYEIDFSGEDVTLDQFVLQEYTVPKVSLTFYREEVEEPGIPFGEEAYLSELNYFQLNFVHDDETQGEERERLEFTQFGGKLFVDEDYFITGGYTQSNTEGVVGEIFELGFGKRLGAHQELTFTYQINKLDRRYVRDFPVPSIFSTDPEPLLEGAQGASSDEDKEGFSLRYRVYVPLPSWGKAMTFELGGFFQDVKETIQYNHPFYFHELEGEEYGFNLGVGYYVLDDLLIDFALDYHLTDLTERDDLEDHTYWNALTLMKLGVQYFFNPGIGLRLGVFFGGSQREVERFIQDPDYVFEEADGTVSGYSVSLSFRY